MSIWYVAADNYEDNDVFILSGETWLDLSLWPDGPVDVEAARRIDAGEMLAVGIITGGDAGAILCGTPQGVHDRLREVLDDIEKAHPEVVGEGGP